MKKFYMKISILLGLLVISSGCVLISALLSSTTSTDGELRLQGLDGLVSIYRDANGVPHITAQASDNDVFFAQGYVHAQDRFWQMEFQRRVGRGALSQLFGKSTLAADEYLRTLGLYRAAQAAWKSYDTRTRVIIERYTAGVNAFLQQKRYPLEIRLLHYQPDPWTVSDTIVWQKMMAWNLQRHSWLNKLDYDWVRQHLGLAAVKQYYPDDDWNKHRNDVVTANNDRVDNIILQSRQSAQMDAQSKVFSSSLEEFVGMRETSGKGSNGWVVSGSRTVSGKPLLANDIHLALSAPNLWYLVELRGRTLHVTGASIPGLPGVAVGHNDQISWGMTNGYNDAADLYLLSDNEKLTSRKETIPVRFSDPVTLTISESRYGPVVNSIIPQLKASGRSVSLKWTALTPGDTTVQSFIKINFANNRDEFVSALKDFVTPTQAFIYADRAGNTGFYYPGRLPLRRWSSLFPVTTDSEHEWRGYIPFDRLPHEVNPARGYIALANYQVVSGEYPFSLNARWPVPSYRIRRIIELLQNANQVSIQQMQAIQADTRSELWLQLKAELFKVVAETTQETRVLRKLEQWDGYTGTDSAAPTIFAYWLKSFDSLVPEALRHSGKGVDTVFLYHYLRDNMTVSDLHKSLERAIANLTRDLGADDENWKWGRIHQADFNANGLGKIPFLGRLWKRSIDTPGAAYTVNVGTYDTETFHQLDGATYRQIVDMGDFDNSLYIIPMGQSGNPFSSHYDDLLGKWRDVKYIKIKGVSGCERGAGNCMLLKPL